MADDYNNLLALAVRDYVGSVVNRVDSSEWQFDGVCERSGTLAFLHTEGWILLFGDALEHWGADLYLPEQYRAPDESEDYCEQFLTEVETAQQGPSLILHALCTVIQQANAYIDGFMIGLKGA